MKHSVRILAILCALLTAAGTASCGFAEKFVESCETDENGDLIHEGWPLFPGHEERPAHPSRPEETDRKPDTTDGETAPSADPDKPDKPVRPGETVPSDPVNPPVPPVPSDPSDPDDPDFEDGGLSGFDQALHIGPNGNWWVGHIDTGMPGTVDWDDRDISEGLSYETVTIDGKIGLTVTAYTGKDTDVVIPNYADDMPVVSISASAFAGNQAITSLSLPKPLLRLDKGAFKGCTKLTHVAFNDAPLTEIPDEAFRDTALIAPVLPSTVTKLGDYAFDGVSLLDINYENITSFGTGSLRNCLLEYVFLPKDVTYAGNGAFASTYVYTEHPAIPEAWGNRVAGTDNLNSQVTTGCSRNDEYIYVDRGDTVTVCFYIGDDKKIAIPSRIGGKPVTEIGYGFNSITQSRANYLLKKSGSLARLKVLDEVRIPSGVRRIEYSALSCYGTMILIPDTVELMWGGTGNPTSFLAFEGSTLPTFSRSYLDYADVYKPDEWRTRIGAFLRLSTGVNFDELSYDEESRSYYCPDGDGYALFALMDLGHRKLTVHASFHGKPVRTILPDAVSNLYHATEIRLESGIEVIRPLAFKGMSLQMAYIPLSVKTIGKYGFADSCNQFRIEAAARPAGWDVQWAGEDSHRYNIRFGSDMA